MRYIIHLLLLLALTACGTSEVLKNPDSTLRVAAQYGALNGSWDRAQQEAVERAKQYCDQMGLQFNFLSEARTGVPGWSPQKSEITFACNPKTVELLKAAEEECNVDYSSSELDSIRGKVELIRRSSEASVPFQIASNETYPSNEERVVISKWAKLRERCIERTRKITDGPVSRQTPLQQVYAEQMRGYRHQLESRVGELIVALYQLKLTYSEFAIKRAEISRNISNAQRDFRTAALLADRDAQMKAQQVAEQQMQNNLMAWSTYMQSVNARQPQIVNVDSNVRLRANCTSSKIGNAVTTNCN